MADVDVFIVAVVANDDTPPELAGLVAFWLSAPLFPCSVAPLSALDSPPSVAAFRRSMSRNFQAGRGLLSSPAMGMAVVAIDEMPLPAFGAVEDTKSVELPDTFSTGTLLLTEKMPGEGVVVVLAMG